MKGVNTWLMILSIFSSIPVFGQSENKTYQMQSKKEIEKRIERFVEDFKNGNGEGFADIFSDKLYDKAKKQAVVKNIQEMHKHFKVDYEVHAETIVVDQNMAYEKGTYTTTLVPKKQGVTVKETQAYIEIWEKEADGKWRIIDAIKHKVEAPLEPTNNTKNLPKSIAKYIGKYQTGGPIIEILPASDNKSMIIFLKDQLDHKLSLHSNNVYTIDGAPGITVKFKEENGKITELEFVQPTGSFIAKKE